MGGLLWLVIFAGFFYLMMRFGCGSHMVHGHGGSGAERDGKDPVCGMDVPEDRGYSKMYGGKHYRFCSRNCLDKFEADPEKYTSAGRAT